MLFAGNITLGICACECPRKGFLVFPGLCCIEYFTLVKSFLGVFSSSVNRLCFCGFSVLSVLTISTQLLIQNYLVQHAWSLNVWMQSWFAAANSVATMHIYCFVPACALTIILLFVLEITSWVLFLFFNPSNGSTLLFHFLNFPMYAKQPVW